MLRNRMVMVLFVLALGCTALAQSTDVGLSQVSNVYRWKQGCTDDGSACGSQTLMNGFTIKRTKANGIILDVLMADTGQMIIAIVAVTNQTAQRFDVLPQAVSLQMIQPKDKVLKYEDPDALGRKIEKRASGNAMLGVLAAAFATRSTTSQSSVSGFGMGNLSTTDSRGNLTMGTYNGTYSGSATATTTQPDYQLRALVLSRSQARIERSAREAQAIRQVALRANTLEPQGFLIGAIYFERDKKAKEVRLRIPVGGYVMEFPFEINR